MNKSLLWNKAVASGKYVAMVAIVVAGALVVSQKSACSCNAAPSKNSEVAVNTEKAVTAKLPKLVDLGAKKCIPCKKMAPILDELTKEYQGIMVVEFIDVWEKENVPKAQQYGIQSIPTQIFLDIDGKELWRHEGYISKEDILSKWKELGYDVEKLKKEKELKK